MMIPPTSLEADIQVAWLVFLDAVTRDDRAAAKNSWQRFMELRKQRAPEIQARIDEQLQRAPA